MLLLAVSISPLTVEGCYPESAYCEGNSVSIVLCVNWALYLWVCMGGGDWMNKQLTEAKTSWHDCWQLVWLLQKGEIVLCVRKWAFHLRDPVQAHYEGSAALAGMNIYCNVEPSRDTVFRTNPEDGLTRPQLLGHISFDPISVISH